MKLNKYDILRSILENKKGAAHGTLPVKLRGELPPTLQMSKEELTKQLEGIHLAEKCAPTCVVQELERTYDKLKRQLMVNQPDDFNPIRVAEHLLEQNRCLAKEKNNKKRKDIEDEHQEIELLVGATFSPPRRCNLYRAPGVIRCLLD